jgi:hypothetical protein
VEIERPQIQFGAQNWKMNQTIHTQNCDRFSNGSCTAGNSTAPPPPPSLPPMCIDAPTQC